jgi:hypothetical protein
MSAITDLGQVTESRLCWPDTKPRAAQRVGSPFKGAHVDREHRQIELELERWRIRQYIISRNHHRIFAGDPGVAVWWLDRMGEIRVLACDKYQSLADNMHSIVLTLAAMRGLERWGAYTAEQAAEGAGQKLLSPPDSDRVDWPTILGVGRDWPIGAIKLAWERKAERSHPDRGGSTDEMSLVNRAWEAARRELDE